MKSFVDEHRDTLGVEPICKVLQIAPSTYHEHAARKIDPARRSRRAKIDEVLMKEIEQVWSENFEVYGARKVWQQLRRQGIEVARCTVERLMKRLGLKGVIRGKAVRTTVSDPKAPCPLDHVKRQFRAERPNALWVADFTYVPTWRGFVYVAFIIDVFARVIVGWRAPSSMQTDFVLDALEQALHARGPFAVSAQISSSRCQSIELRARRETSRPSTMPACPMPTSATKCWNPRGPSRHRTGRGRCRSR